MKKALFSLLVLLFFSSPLLAMRLVDELKEAKDGDYLVTQQDRTYALVLVRQRLGERIILEEIALPESEKRAEKWSEWVKSGAPGHTSWTAHEIELQSGRLNKSYSYSRRGWVDVKETDPFLTRLLTLEFTPVPNEERRRVGPPAPGGLERRPVWQPPLVFQGRREKGVVFNAFRAEWPRDGSVTAGRTVTVYLPEPGPYPSYFPYWLEIKGPVTPIRLRVVDSGVGLRSPQPPMF